MPSRNVNLILVGLNIALIGLAAYLWFLLRGDAAPPRLLLTPRPVTNTITQIAVRKINATNLLNLAPLLSRPRSWGDLESTNYSQYIANLQAFGVPDETIRDLIITDVARLYGARRAALRAQVPRPKFWETGDAWETGASPRGEIARQLRALDDEERDLIRQLLGVDLKSELARYTGEEEAGLQHRYDFLSPEKRDRVLSVLERFEEMEQAIYSRTQGLILDEDQEQLKQIEKAREAELAHLLDPEEMENYQLRHSNTANSLRYQLAGFNPSEEEFRKIFRLQKTFEDEFAQSFDPTDEQQMEVRALAQQEAQEALNQEIKQVLGEPRFAEYERAQDGDYKSLVQIGQRFDLNQDAINRVYGMKAMAERQKEAVEANPDLSDVQRQAALAAIAQETERSVSQVMGDAVFKAYRSTGGQWISSLGTYVAPEPPPEPVTQTVPVPVFLPPPGPILPPLPR
jgi:hypothetical protein